MEKQKKVKWLPVFSFFAFLFLLFSLGSLIGGNLGAGSLIASVVWFVGTLATFFEENFKILKSYWVEQVLPEAHISIIFFSIILGLFLLFEISRNYRLDVNFEKQ